MQSLLCHVTPHVNDVANRAVGGDDMQYSMCPCCSPRYGTVRRSDKFYSILVFSVFIVFSDVRRTMCCTCYVFHQVIHLRSRCNLLPVPPQVLSLPCKSGMAVCSVPYYIAICVLHHSSNIKPLFDPPTLVRNAPCQFAILCARCSGWSFVMVSPSCPTLCRLM